MSARLIPVLTLCGVTALFAGCGGSNPSPQDMAKYSSKALGIPVFLWAKSDDACVVKQLGAFYQEYTKAKKEKKSDQLVEKFKAYSAVIVQVSEDAGTVKHDTYKVNLLERVCRNQWSATSSDNTERVCSPEHSKAMKWADAWTSTTGKYPGTRVELGGDNDGSPRVLYITPVSAKDLSTARIYKTTDGGIYSALGSSADFYLPVAIKNKSVELESATPADPMNCGKLATFADLFQAK